MKSKRLLLLLLMAIGLPWAANAQNRATVTIGTGTSTQYYPLPGFYGWNYNVFLYTPTAAPELGVDSDISSIAFDVSTNNTNTGSEMYIWVKDVDADYALATTTTFANYITDATQVYSNDEFSSTLGWNTFNFSSTFSHQGGKALLVAVRGVGCSTGGGCSRQCHYTTATNTYWYKNQDSSDPGQTVSGSLSSSRANIQLSLTYTAPVCMAPTGLAATLTPGNGTVATLNWTPGAEETVWVLEYGTASDFTGATPVNVSGTPQKALSGLTAEQTYYARVKPDCDTDGTKWSNTCEFTPTNVYSVTVNEGTSTSGYAPLYGNYNSSYDQMIYTASQLEDAGITGPCTITKIGFNSSAANSNARKPIIYIYQTDKSSFSSTTDFISINEFTKVYDFNDHSQWNITAGWNEFELDTPFDYDGSSNLVVAVHCGMASYKSTSFYYSTTTSNQVIYAYSDSTDPIPATYEGNWANYPTTGASATSYKAVSTNLPSLKLYYTPVTVTCAKPTGLVESNTTAHGVTITWNSETGETFDYAIVKGTGIDPETVTYAGSETATGTTCSHTWSSGLDGDSDYTVFIRKNCGNGDYSNPATKVIHTEIACPAPTVLTWVESTTTTAKFSWTDNAGASEWQICINDDETNLIPANSNTNFIVSTGLSAASTYTAKVRAVCGGVDGESAWSNTVSFDTQCETITITDSWSENFNSLTAGIPNCWDNSVGTTTTESYKWNYYATGHDGACLRFDSYFNSSGNTNFLKTPTFNFATGKIMQLSFWFKNPTGDDFSVYISTDGGNTYTTALATGLTGVSSWTQQEITLTNYVDTQNVVIVFKGTSNYGSDDAYIYLDDVAIVQAPNCIKPTGLAVTANSITSDGATITWAAGGEETQWQIEFATDADFTNPLYETVNADPDDEAYIPTYTFHGLADATTYYVHVQAVCGGSDGSSEYNDPVSFTTLQTPTNLPYATDFESGNDWLLVNGELTNAWAYGTATSNGGTHALYISNDGGTTNAYTINSAAMVYATKLFNFEDGIYVFSYDWKTYGETYSDYLRVALVPASVTLTAGTTMPTGFGYSALPTGWIALDGGGKLNLQTEWQSFTSDEMEVAAGSYMMVFAWRDDTSVGTNPPAAIDNVSIAKITCTTPTNLDAPDSGITATSAQLIWTETGEATAWEIELTDEEDHVTTIPVDEDDLVEGVYTIRDLSSEKVYSVRVRANCGDGYSNWSEEEIFETAEDCQTPDGLAATTTSSSAVISWNGYGQEEFNLRYGTDGETWTTEPRVTNNYTLADLTPATTYYVQVQPTCADEETWSAEYSFTTECDVITIAQDAAYTYDFEEETPMTCWTNVAGSNVRSSGSNNTTGGNYKLQFKGTTTGNIVAMPAFTPDINGLMLTFWTRPEGYSYSSCGTFSVGYMTDLDDASTFVPVATYSYNDWTSNTYIEKKVAFSSAPAGAYIAFCQNAGATNYYWYVDDVTVEIAPSYTKTIAPYTSDGGYYLIASPLADAVDPATAGMITDELEGEDVTPETSTYDLYSFDQTETDEWRNYRETHFNLVNGQGYLYASKEGTTITFTGVPYSGTTKDVTLNKTADAEFEGWNLVGNPFTDTAYCGRPFYVMEEGGARILATEQTGKIPPMEGVFVIAANDGETMTFTTQAPGAKANIILNLTQGRSNTIDRAIVSVGQGSTLPKFMFNPNDTKLYMPKNGEDYAVVRGNTSDEIPVSFVPAEDGFYNISVDVRNMNLRSLVLKDYVRNVSVDLLRTPTYQFKASIYDRPERFILSFKTGPATHKEKIVRGGNSENFGFYSNGNWIIDNEGEATLQVIDLNGRVLSSEAIYGSTSIQVDAAPGVYMLRLINGDNMKVQKVVVE